MRIKFTVVGRTPEPDHFQPVWADLDAVPREGETVHLPGLEPELQHVRTVVWRPVGDDEHAAPYVYVVLGHKRAVHLTRPDLTEAQKNELEALKARYEQAVMLARRDVTGKSHMIVDADGVHPWPGLEGYADE